MGAVARSPHPLTSLKGPQPLHLLDRLCEVPRRASSGIVRRGWSPGIVRHRIDGRSAVARYHQGDRHPSTVPAFLTRIGQRTTGCYHCALLRSWVHSAASSSAFAPASAFVFVFAFMFVLLHGAASGACLKENLVDFRRALSNCLSRLLGETGDEVC
jgi:hypothetical protein